MKKILLIIAFLGINLYGTAQFSQNEHKQIVIAAVDCELPTFNKT